ncbi:DUF2726 domain-containing protein [Halomonas getboli]|uniref:DUF2726 domain-containing protein n=1 Tax=Halomonas getboli TaxID=2935862 RepID=UPI001FFFC326|nr:DUF2726 domain-containing protein [Halomonas getboli]MCK2183855.1 DUF2726 domain-containing protein [Halomonas getboli]
MEQAMQELTNTVVTFTIYGVLFMAALTILKIIFYRSSIGKLLGSGNKRKRGRRRGKADPKAISSTAQFVYAQYKDHERKTKADAWKSPQEPAADLAEKREKSDRNYSEELMGRGDAYIARTHLMTPTERDVFKVLQKAYGDKYHIFCQVRVVDIIQPNTSKYHAKSKEYMSLFRQLSQWHFDYVLCSRDDLKVFCALELDDKTHERPERRKRDRIINMACEVSGLRLERMVVDHNKKALK